MKRLLIVIAASLVVFGLGGLGLVGCNNNEAPAEEMGTTNTSAGGDIRSPGTVGGTGTSVGTGTGLPGAVDGTGTPVGDGAGSSEAAGGTGGALSPAPIRPLTAPVSERNGWSYCGEAYWALENAIWDLEKVPPDNFVGDRRYAPEFNMPWRNNTKTWHDVGQFGVFTWEQQQSFACFPVNASDELRRAAIPYGGNDLQKCWESDRSAPGWPSECPHPQQIADEIARIETQMDAAHLTDELAAAEGDPSFDNTLLNIRRTDAVGFSVSGIPYFLVQANGGSFGLPAASIRLLRAMGLSPSWGRPGTIKRIYDTYYKEDASSPQAVICINLNVYYPAEKCVPNVRAPGTLGRGHY